MTESIVLQQLTARLPRTGKRRAQLGHKTAMLLWTKRSRRASSFLVTTSGVATCPPHDIRHLVKQMETHLQCYCFETIAMCQGPEQQDPYVHRLAKDLAQFLALFLAETVTELLQCVLADPSRGLVDASNAPLLTPKFWVQAIYTELLHASKPLQGGS